MKREVFFLGVGAQKAGTSWIGKYLNSHPQVFMSPIKELHYFDCKYLPEFRYLKNKFKKRLENAEKSDSPEKRNLIPHLRSRLLMEDNLHEYNAYFERFKGKKRVFGEITPSYALLNYETFDKIKSYIPYDVKILFILRNPIDRFLSQINFASDLDESFDPDINKQLNNPQFYQRSNYKSTLNNLSRIWSLDNIFICFYEDLFNEDNFIRQKTLESLNLFLGISNHRGDFERIVNKTKSKRTNQLNRKDIFKKFEQTYEFFYQNQILFGDLPANWKKDISAFG